MELLDRYLQAVRFWLPRAQQDDIVAELGDDLRSQIEERESALGRPLIEDELASLLDQSGHPMRVAARYQPQHSLIGPALFPLYKFVLKIVTFGYLTPWILVWIGLVVFMPSYRSESPVLTAIAGWAALWSNVFFIFGLITLIFALLERVQSSVAVLYKWDPRTLPRVVQGKQRVSRVESIFGLVFSILFVIWWLSLPRYGNVLFGPAAGFLSVNPALRAWFLPALVPTIILMVQQCVNLVRPQWTWIRAASLFLAEAISLVIVALVARLRPFVLLADTGKDTAQHTQAVFIVNQIILWSLIGAAAGVAIALVVHAWQTVRELRRATKNVRNGAALSVSQVI
jgi:hypothetical protein